MPALVQLADCLATDGERARALLEEALAMGTEGADVEAIQERLRRLPGSSAR